jgi:hypothetical protein
MDKRPQGDSWGDAGKEKMNEKEPEQVKGNSNWRHKIKELNLHYLSLVKLIANNHENPGYVRTTLGLDQAQYEQLMNMSDEVIFRIADVGACLFRLKWNELKRADSLFGKDAEQAGSLLTSALVAEGAKAKEGEA